MKKVNLQFFAKVIDLTDKLSEAKPLITIKGEDFEVKDGFKTMLELDSLMKNKKGLSQMEQLEQIFFCVFEEDKAKALIDKNYPIAFYKEILSAVLTLVKGDDDSGK